MYELGENIRYDIVVSGAQRDRYIVRKSFWHYYIRDESNMSLILPEVEIP